MEIFTLDVLCFNIVDDRTVIQTRTITNVLSFKCKCVRCGGSFDTRLSLRDHFKSHSNEVGIPAEQQKKCVLSTANPVCAAHSTSIEEHPSINASIPPIMNTNQLRRIINTANLLVPGTDQLSINSAFPLVSTSTNPVSKQLLKTERQPHDAPKPLLTGTNQLSSIPAFPLVSTLTNPVTNQPVSTVWQQENTPNPLDPGTDLLPNSSAIPLGSTASFSVPKQMLKTERRLHDAPYPLVLGTYQLPNNSSTEPGSWATHPTPVRPQMVDYVNAERPREDKSATEIGIAEMRNMGIKLQYESSDTKKADTSVVGTSIPERIEAPMTDLTSPHSDINRTNDAEEEDTSERDMSRKESSDEAASGEGISTDRVGGDEIGRALYEQDIKSVVPTAPFSNHKPTNLESEVGTNETSSALGDLNSVDPKEYDINNQCHFCGKNLPRLSALQLHIHLVHSRTKTAATTGTVENASATVTLPDSGSTQSVASKRRTKKTSTKNQVGRSKIARDKYVCPECGKHLGSRTSLQAHIQILHRYRPYACGICGKRFGRVYDQRSHVLIHSRERKVYTCAWCDRVLSTSRSLESHIYIDHPDVEPYSCDVCHKKFKQKETRRKHIKTHDPNHMLTKPKRILKKELCHLCGATVNCVSSHWKAHHSGTRERHVCPKCGKTFTLKESLKTHDMIHTGVKPYKCNVCGQSFSRKWVLIVHKRTHTGEKPYPCGVCGKSFTASGDLSKHQHRMHSNLLRQYRCTYVAPNDSVCGKTFIRRDAYIRHTQNRHDVKTPDQLH